MEIICRNCGHVGEPEQSNRGHVLISLLLLCLFIIPGIIYIVWRRSDPHLRCERCGSIDTVAQDSPFAAQLLNDRITPQTHVRCPDCKELVRHDAIRCKHCGVGLTPVAPTAEPTHARPPAQELGIGYQLGKAWGGLNSSSKMAVVLAVAVVLGVSAFGT